MFMLLFEISPIAIESLPQSSEAKSLLAAFIFWALILPAVTINLLMFSFFPISSEWRLTTSSLSDIFFACFNANAVFPILGRAAIRTKFRRL
ncbi:unnamed protein product [Bacillus phage SPP1]|uniref:Bacteriophage SPP1 complete nucleotide sequence n=1 Tax=Bacillus phage SPP1 TaxID=10724 RepID=O48493_BPSPP|nr:hypothetical protein SPP1p088 [Bacillus phage SPP1]CAA66498.1 unnamed protein product [Bacillus phage SPP1]